MSNKQAFLLFKIKMSEYDKLLSSQDPLTKLVERRHARNHIERDDVYIALKDITQDELFLVKDKIEPFSIAYSTKDNVEEALKEFYKFMNSPNKKPTTAMLTPLKSKLKKLKVRL